MSTFQKVVSLVWKMNCLGLFVVKTAIAVMGGSVGNGTDNFPLDYASAWFLGDRPIRYCYVVGENFGIAHAQIEKTLTEVNQTWRNYLQNKQANIHRYHHSPVGFKSSGYLVLNTERLSHCDGTEDLKIYFGVTDLVVKKYLVGHFRPLAFAERTQYDRKAGWGKGFIWVAPSQGSQAGPHWEISQRLHGVLLHEWGHLLGVAHVDHTIMREDFNRLIWGEGLIKLPNIDLTRIDHERELLLCEHCNVKYVGKPLHPVQKPFDAAAFSPFIGRPLQGLVKSEVIDELPKGKESLNFTLRLEDEVGKWKFRITQGARLAGALGDAFIFKRIVTSGVPGYFESHLHPEAISYQGELHLDGKSLKLPVLIHRNMDNRQLSIRVVKHLHESKFLFLTELP